VYYSQPILPQIAESLGVSQVKAGLISSATLLGFGLGLLLVAPLADVLEKRRLMVTLLWVDGVLFATAAFSRNFTVFLAVSLLTGVSAISGQIAIPYVARLSAPNERGRNLGVLLSGALIGILLARTGSGFIAGHFGWRAVYLTGTGLMLALGVLLQKSLPADPGAASIEYRELLQSVWSLFSGIRELRFVAINGSLMYASLTGFWVTLSFLLNGSHFHLGPEAVGMFGLVGALSAGGVSLAGSLADRMNPRRIVQCCIALMLAGYVALSYGAGSIAFLIAGTILLDIGAQAATVSNQTQIYRLNSGAQGRLNTIYKLLYNLGGTVGAALAGLAWQTWGWSGVCATGIGFLVMALAVEWVAHSFGTRPAAILSVEAGESEPCVEQAG
jgi:predicted MFS family arabinose efflux permease